MAVEETQALTIAPAEATRCLVVAVTPSEDTSPAVIVERYYVKLGEQVQEGAAVCLARSERYVFDLPAGTAGIVEELLAEPGTMVTLGQPLLRIGPGAPSVVEAIPTPPSSPALRATPLARHIAIVHNVELGTLKGTGAGGRIRAADVRALVSDGTEPVLGECQPNLSPVIVPLASEPPVTISHAVVSPASEPVAQHGERASFVIHDEHPFALTAVAVDLPAADLVAQNGARLARCSPGITTTTAAIVYAAVTTLIEHPWLNSAWTDEGVIIYGRVDLGILTHVNGSARLTVVERAADLSVQGLARAMTTASMAATHQPTFTIMPMTSGWWSEPASVTSSAVVLGIGQPVRRPSVYETRTDPTLVIRDRVLLTLAYDARYIAHSEADAFLCSVRTALHRLVSFPTGLLSR